MADLGQAKTVKAVDGGTIINNTQVWSTMQADVGKPAVLTPKDGKKSTCDTVYAGSEGTSLAPGFQMRA